MGEYTISDVTPGKDPKQSLKFNICGTVREVCAPYVEELGGVLPPFTRGIAIQYIDNDIPLGGNMCIDTNTCDFATDPQCVASTVQTVNCTGDCEIVAPYTGAAPIFALLDETNPQGGISLRYEGAPAYSGDPFGSCPLDVRTGLAAQRAFTINLFCNPAVADFSDMVRRPQRGAPPDCCAPPPLAPPPHYGGVAAHRTPAEPAAPPPTHTAGAL